MKTCFKCNVQKPLTEFYKHPAMADGHVNKCKECNKDDVTKHRLKNIDRIREYDRKRGKNLNRISLSTEITKAWRAEDKRRAKCHYEVTKAIKNGELFKKPCVKCNDAKSLAHHEDYDKPLDVVWLCQSCHKKRHIEIKLILKGEIPCLKKHLQQWQLSL
jgi:hypothetical protein